MKSSDKFLERIANDEFPTLHVSYDETRLCKRNFMQAVINCGQHILLLPLQEVSDLGAVESHTAKDKEEELASMAPMSLGDLASLPSVKSGTSRRASFVKGKVATAVVFGSLCHALRRFANITFSVCTGHPLLPLGKHESRRPSVSRPGAYVVENQATGPSLLTRNAFLKAL